MPIVATMFVPAVDAEVNPVPPPPAVAAVNHAGTPMLMPFVPSVPTMTLPTVDAVVNPVPAPPLPPKVGGN